jgi:pilus assembly protein TadC
MSAFEKFYVKLSSAIPNKIVSDYQDMLIAADWQDNARSYLGFTSILSLLIAFVALMFLLSIGLNPILALPASVIVLIALVVTFYLRVALAADARAAQIESYLPEALQLIAANIRAGMTVDQALWLCARPEFGPLEKELRKMAAETLGGKPITQALTESAKRVKSVTLDRAYRLLIQGIQLGGALANLLTEIASDIRTNQALRNEITAATTMYTIFILFSSVLAAPMLFAVSTFYVQATNKIMSTQSGGSQPEMSGTKSVLKISASQALTVDEVRLFSLACIIITTFFGALTVGLIKYGEAKRGIKYIPLFSSAALAIYFIGFFVVSSAFSSIMY